MPYRDIPEYRQLEGMRAVQVPQTSAYKVPEDLNLEDWRACGTVTLTPLKAF